MNVDPEETKLKVPRDPNRSEGLHLSTILRQMALDRGVLSRKYEKQGDLDDNVVLQIGMAWEDYLAMHQHQDIIYHPGELILDGIFMSPDGISIADDDDKDETFDVEEDSWILHEFKATRKSSRGFQALLGQKDKKCLLWLWQIMAYRYAMNRLRPESPCYAAKLHVLFLNGNYSRDMSDPEGRPTYKIYRLTFTPEELETNWAVIKSYADSMGD